MGLNQVLNYYKNKRIFITGHTGFKGSWLSFLLDQNGAVTKGYSLNPKTKPSLYNSLKFSNNHSSVISDIRNDLSLKKELKNFKPDFIFHLAAQPLVIDSYDDPKDTFETNFTGTLNILESIRDLDLCCTVIIVTTDKVYQNNEDNISFKENDKLGGKDPYSASKSAAEILISSYTSSFFKDSRVKIASVRAGNVIGGGDWSKNRLIPDLVRSIFENKQLIIRNPKSTRPWQHVLEPLYGYLQLGVALNKKNNEFQGSWNFGPEKGDNKSVNEILNIAKSLGFNLEIKFEENNSKKEAKYLSLNIEKAKYKLNWKPKWNSKIALEHTLNWYKDFYNDNDASLLLKNEILSYLKK